MRQPQAFSVISKTGSGSQRQYGLTLREVLTLVLIIVAVLAAIAPAILNRLDSYRVQTAHEQLARISEALERYKLDNHQFPTSEQGLAALVRKPTLSPVPANWDDEGYLSSRDLTDPWGHRFVYQSREEGLYYELSSMGEDGMPGGSGQAADIHSDGSE